MSSSVPNPGSTHHSQPDLGVEDLTYAETDALEPFAKARQQLADRLLRTSDEEVLVELVRQIPEMATNAELRALNVQAAADLRRATAAAVMSGINPSLETSGEVRGEIITRLADRDVGEGTVGAALIGAHRAVIRTLLAQTCALLPPEQVVALLPGLVDLALGGLERSYRNVIDIYLARLRWNRERSDARRLARLRSVLDGEVTDLAVATRLLSHPLAGWHVGAVVRARFDVEDALAGLRVRLEQAVPGARIFMAQTPQDIVSLWVTSDVEPAPRQWRELLSQDERLIGAVGEPAVGLAGFIRTHAQGQAAYEVVAASHYGPRVADYSQVAPLTFLIANPARTREWLAETLGDLADSGPDAERLRYTLQHYLAAGENASTVAAGLYVHRNTVTYRVGQAIERLPHGLEGHRTEVALALDLLKWVPDAIKEM